MIELRIKLGAHQIDPQIQLAQPLFGIDFLPDSIAGKLQAAQHVRFHVNPVDAFSVGFLCHDAVAELFVFTQALVLQHGQFDSARQVLFERLLADQEIQLGNREIEIAMSSVGERRIGE